MYRTGKCTETENGLVDAGAESGEEEGVTAKGFRVSLWGDQNVLDLDSGDGCKYNLIELHMLKRCELYLNLKEKEITEATR